MNYAGLLKAIDSATVKLQGRAATAVNQALVIRNWMVGAYLIEYEQNGRDRAKYGERLLATLANDLAAREVKGLGDPRVLRDCRAFYRAYPQIRGSLTREFSLSEKFPQQAKKTSSPARNRGSVTRDLPSQLSANEVLRFSWTHLQELIRIEDSWKRAFYENQCLNSRWSVRQLQRQVGSLLYERTGLSTEK